MGELNWIESFVHNLNSVFLTQEHRCQHVAGESLQRVDFTTSLPLRLSAIFTSTRWQQRQILQTLVSVCAGGIQFLHQTRQKRIIQLKHNIYLNSGALYYQWYLRSQIMQKQFWLRTHDFLLFHPPQCYSFMQISSIPAVGEIRIWVWLLQTKHCSFIGVIYFHWVQDLNTTLN